MMKKYTEGPGGRPRLLLHVCCAPCSPYVVELLQQEYEVTAYFYDPNIHPEEEYQDRLQEMRRFCKETGLALITAEYEAARWFRMMQGHEHDPERGERCALCFRMRLEKAACFAAENGFSIFSTVLSVSPHKDAKVLNTIGRDAGRRYGVDFYEANFKKKNGFKITVAKGREMGLKRQDYCGCAFSRDRSGNG